MNEVDQFLRSLNLDTEGIPPPIVLKDEGDPTTAKRPRLAHEPRTRGFASGISRGCHVERSEDPLPDEVR